MKKALGLFIALALVINSFASFVVENPPKKASDIFIPLGQGKKISLLDLSEINLKQFEEATGKKMKLIEKIEFKLAQKELRNSINEDGTLNSKKLEKAFKRLGGETGFHFGGFALGFFLGLIGVLIAYLIKDDFKRNRVKWAWLGVGIALVLNIILILALL